MLRRSRDIVRNAPDPRNVDLPGGVKDLNAVEAGLRKSVGSPEAYEELERLADELMALNDEHVLTPLMNEGIISKETKGAFLGEHPNHIPFARVFDPTDDLLKHGTDKAVANVSSTGFRTMSRMGSTRKLDSPLERLYMEPVKTATIIARNKTARAMYEALTELEVVKEFKPGTLIRETTPGRVPHDTFGAIRDTDPGFTELDGTFSFFDEGVQRTFAVEPVYERVAKGLASDPNSGMALKIIGAANSPLKRGATEFDIFFRRLLVPWTQGSHHAQRVVLRGSKEWSPHGRFGRRIPAREAACQEDCDWRDQFWDSSEECQ